MIAVNRTRVLVTGFPASIETGLRPRSDFDLVLTELKDKLLIEACSLVGLGFPSNIPPSPVSGELTLSSARLFSADVG